MKETGWLFGGKLLTEERFFFRKNLDTLFSSNFVWLVLSQGWFQARATKKSLLLFRQQELTVLWINCSVHVSLRVTKKRFYDKKTKKHAKEEYYRAATQEETSLFPAELRWFVLPFSEIKTKRGSHLSLPQPTERAALPQAEVFPECHLCCRRGDVSGAPLSAPLHWQGPSSCQSTRAITSPSTLLQSCNHCLPGLSWSIRAGSHMPGARRY